MQGQKKILEKYVEVKFESIQPSCQYQQHLDICICAAMPAILLLFEQCSSRRHEEEKTSIEIVQAASGH